MSYEEELEQLQQDAMNEIEGNDDGADTNDSELEESTDEPDNNREDENDREDTSRDEEENDYEDDEELDEEDLSDDDDDTTSDTDSVDEESDTGFEPVEVTIGGQTISLNSQEELIAFVRKGGGANTPTRQRKSQNDQIIEQGALSESDLALLIDAKKGNKAAIAKLAKDSGVDIYDIDDDAASGYKQDFQPTYATEIDEVAQDIMEDTTLHTEFQSVVKNVPQDFAQLLASDPGALRNFAGHVKSGLAQKVIPEAIKQQMLHGGTFLDNYAKIGREMSDEKKPAEQSKTKRKENPRADKLRERAKNHKGSNKGTKTKVTGEDIWNMSKDDFNKQYM